jgi:hypothetical protein
LTIRNLRGSVRPFTLAFEQGKKLTIVYGENGTGKTTICDALEFMGNGRVGSIENRGLGRTNRYWPAVGKSSKDVSVSLETTMATCHATLRNNDVIIDPPQHRPRVRVLRRAQILSLVEAKPAERYSAIKQFIDISGIEASEAALRNSLKEVNASLNTAVTRLDENRQTIEQFWQQAGRPGTSAYRWAQRESLGDNAASEAEIAFLADLHTAYQKLAAFPGQLAAAQDNINHTQETLAQAQSELAEAVAAVAQDALETVRVLEAAHHYLFHHPQPAVCPLCESAEHTAGLSGRVAERLAAFTTLRTAQQNQRTSDRAAQEAEELLIRLHKDARQAAEDFETYQPPEAWLAFVPMPAVPVPADLADWPAWLAQHEHLPRAWKQAEGERQDKRYFLGTLRRALETYDENFQARQELVDLLPRLQRALEILEAERHDFTDKMLARIAAEVGRLYAAVHPGEELHHISLVLDPQKRASLEIGASFSGRTGLPPQAYFSESHLDTLGLCVFLALAGLDAPDETILVLDDVLASVDEPHVDRLIEMLYQEAERFHHCLITTHYRPWKHKLRWGWLQNGQCQFVELTRWTAVDGLATLRAIPDVDRLERLLQESPPDPQLVCAKAGVILEAALDFLTLLYECHVPRRADGRYTLGDLLPAIDTKKLRPALQVEVYEGQDEAGVPIYRTVYLKPYLDELARIAQARNVFGCHFNDISFAMLETDAIQFGWQVWELMRVLTDPAAGWPRSDRSGRYWATTGETRRLHPLKRPG